MCSHIVERMRELNIFLKKIFQTLQMKAETRVRNMGWGIFGSLHLVCASHTARPYWSPGRSSVQVPVRHCYYVNNSILLTPCKHVTCAGPTIVSGFSEWSKGKGMWPRPGSHAHQKFGNCIQDRRFSFLLRWDAIWCQAQNCLRLCALINGKRSCEVGKKWNKEVEEIKTKRWREDCENFYYFGPRQLSLTLFIVGWTK